VAPATPVNRRRPWIRQKHSLPIGTGTRRSGRTGVATLGFAAFAVQLSVAGRVFDARCCCWLVTLSGFSGRPPRWPSSSSRAGRLWRLGARGLDTLRLACAVSFLAVVLLYSRPRPRPARGGLFVFTLIPAADGAGHAFGHAASGGVRSRGRATLIFGSHLALAAAGGGARRAGLPHSPSTLRWNLRPLCIRPGRAVRARRRHLLRRAAVPRGFDPHFWAARGFAYALAMPAARPWRRSATATGPSTSRYRAA